MQTTTGRPPAVAAAEAARGVGRSLPRVEVAAAKVMGAAGGLLTVVGLWSGQPALSLLGLMISTAAVLLTWLAWDLALPAAALVLVGLASSAGVAAAATDVDLLTSSGWLVAVMLGWSMTALLLVRRLRVPWWRRPAPVKSGAACLAYGPALVAAAVAAVQAASTSVAASWALQGTDLAQHAIELQGVRQAGQLDYLADLYPRGLHMLAALVGGPGAPTEPATLLAHDLRLFAACSWFSLALVLLMGAGLVLRITSSVALPPRVGLLATTGLGVLLLVLSGTVNVFVSMGAAPSLLAVLVIWSLPAARLELGAVARERRGALTTLLIAAVSTALLAHLWQALLLVPVVALLLSGSPRRWLHLLRQLGPRAAAGAAAAVAACALLALPALLGVMRAGASLAGIPGEVPQPPWPFLAVGALALLVLPLLRSRFRSLLVLAGPTAGLLLVTAVLLRGADNGFDLTQYYPMKALWFLTLVLMPVTVVVAAAAAVSGGGRLWVVLARLGAAARVARVASFGVLAALVVSFVLPQIAAARSATLDALRPLWDPAAAELGEDRLQIANQHGARYAPRVTVPVAVGTSAILDRYGSYVISKLMSYETGQPQSHGRALFVCSDIDLVAGDRPAVVVTKLDATLLQQLMERDGCGDVPIVQIPGGIADADMLFATSGRS